MAAEPLDWFPKKFAPGDIDGTGGDRLLGRSSLGPLEILIRETAQNSWDAWTGGAPPSFGLRFRRTTPRMRAELVTLLKDGRERDLHAQERDQSFRVLEIFDRGTSGLDGPVDLRPARGGESSNYQDLILKVGVATHEGKGGGTYGFGKTAAFAYSRMGTVVYWTRCRNAEGELEHRFIVSAIRGSYTDRNVQYTGRHWWGVADGESILPVTGERAEALGSLLFERGFEGEETGTSVLVLDPQPLQDPAEEDGTALRELAEQDRRFAEQARRAIRRNLWPKLVPGPGKSEPPMRISLNVNGQDVSLQEDPPGLLAYWEAALNAVRAKENSDAVLTKPPIGAKVETFPITRSIKSRTRVLGHLALVRYLPEVLATADDDLDPGANDSTIDRICLMRNQAELVVANVPWFTGMPENGMQWLAVFKPVAEFDHIYAESEPPAHDDWVSSGAEDDVARIVRHTKSRVAKTLRETLLPEPKDAPAEETRAVVDAGDLARRLSSLLPAAPMSQPDSVSGRGGGRAATPRKKNDVLVAVPHLVATAADGAQHQRLGFRAVGEDPVITVELKVSQVGDGVKEDVPPHMMNIRWIGGARPTGPARAVAQRDADCWVEFFGPPRRALRIELKAVKS